MSRISVNGKAVCGYLFVLILVYLAGTYVGAFYYYLYIFMIVLPLYSIVQVVISAMTLECIQSIDVEAPAKGDVVRYRVWVTGRPLLTTEVSLRFKSVHSRLPFRIPEIHVGLAGKRIVEKSFDIRLRFRGTYTIGIESVHVADALGWLSVQKRGSFRTFIVQPRILPLLPPVAETRVHALSESGINGVEQDLTLFEGLAGYREGEPVKHIAWKKYLTTGTPYLKQFGGSSEPAVLIYLDLRVPEGHPSEGDELVPTTEDCSIEMAISLVKGYLDRGNRVTVRSAGRRVYSFVGTDRSDFARFFADTDDLIFTTGASSPVLLYETDRSEGLTVGSVLFITHVIDEQIFETVGERSRSGDRTGVFFNLTALNGVEHDRVASYGQAVRSSASGLYYAAHAETLKEDLLQWQTR